MLSSSEDMALVAMMEQMPTLVVCKGKLDLTLFLNRVPYHGLLIEYLPGRSDITVTCTGLFRRGVLYNLTNSLGHMKDVCRLASREIRIAYNRLPPLFDVINQEVDSTTLEGPFLETFLEKYDLRPTFVNANYNWGSKNETSGIWDGLIGLVKIF